MCIQACASLMSVMQPLQACRPITELIITATYQNAVNFFSLSVTFINADQTDKSFMDEFRNMKNGQKAPTDIDLEYTAQKQKK